MKYKKIMPRIWYQLRHKAEKEKIVALYCLTSPQSNRLGFYVLSEAMASEETDINIKEFQKTLESVCNDFGWSYDRETRMLLIPSWFKFNPPDNENVEKSLLKEFEDLPYSKLTSEFISICEGFGIPFPRPIVKVKETVNLTVKDTLGATVKQISNSNNSNNSSSNSTLIPFQEIFDLYNKTCLSLSRIKEMTSGRKMVVKRRYTKMPSLATWKSLFEKVEESNFLTNRRGQNRNNWKATFDWILEEKNMVKIMEGNYDNGSRRPPSKEIEGLAEWYLQNKEEIDGSKQEDVSKWDDPIEGKFSELKPQP